MFNSVPFVEDCPPSSTNSIKRFATQSPALHSQSVGTYRANHRHLACKVRSVSSPSIYTPPITHFSPSLHPPINRRQQYRHLRFQSLLFQKERFDTFPSTSLNRGALFSARMCEKQSIIFIFAQLILLLCTLLAINDRRRKKTLAGV